MTFRSLVSFRERPAYLQIAGVVVLLAAVLALVDCGSNRPISGTGTGTVNVTLSDPPSCATPSGDFKHVYISVRSVQAHISGNANDNSSGWQELAPQLVSAPLQIDLLGTPTLECVLAKLGSTSSLPAGDYQQIRLLLVSNTPGASDPKPSPNNCAGHGFNCVVLSDESIREIELSSQQNTGLKIPPGQILGGPIHVAAGQSVDLNIDFNTCASLVRQGNGKFRLRPTLTAGQVDANRTGIGGKVVDSVTKLPINGTVFVALEQQTDSSGIDRIIMQTTADSNGNFRFCPLPTGVYDVVAVALAGGVAYNATAVLNVSNGADLGQIPLIAETGASTGPGTIQGLVTATTGTTNTAAGATAASINAAMSAVQTISLGGGSTRKLTIPLLAGSTENLAVDSATPSGLPPCPANTNCAQYTLVVPASNPSFATFSTSGFTFSTPAAPPVLYLVDARATRTTDGGTPTCSPSEKTQDKNSTDLPLSVTAGATTTAKQIDFTGCS